MNTRITFESGWRLDCPLKCHKKETILCLTTAKITGNNEAKGKPLLSVCFLQNASFFRKIFQIILILYVVHLFVLNCPSVSNATAMD